MSVLIIACSGFFSASAAFAIDPPTIFRVEPDHSATDTEAALRGFGAASEGLGVGLHHLAAAQVKLQEARRLATQNRYEEIDAYQRLKSERDQRERLSRIPPARADLVRRAKEAAPGRITVNDLTPAGDLLLPVALHDERFAELRAQLEASFQAWCASTTTSEAVKSRQQVEISRQSLAAALQQEVRSFSSADYLAAKKFLERLGYETRVNSSTIPPHGVPALATTR
jgi:hypothetical protein